MHSTEPEAVSPETLLRHAGFVRAVARSLLRDENRVDDVVQETWLAALKSPPDDCGALRSWLARVTRNFARMSQRGEARRHTRELRAARPEMTPSTDETVARALWHKRVAESVLELDSAHRDVLLLLYFEGLSPGETARRLGVTTATVRNRRLKGIEQLRERFERRHGGAWSVALLPLAFPARTATPVVGIAASILLGLAGITALLVFLGDEETDREVPEQRAEESERPAPPAAIGEDEEVRWVEGRVVGPDGRVVAGARVEAWSATSLLGQHWDPIRNWEVVRRGPGAPEFDGESGASGAFRLALPRDRPYRFVVRAPGLVSHHIGGLDPSADVSELQVRLLHEAQLSGVVVDSEGRPLEAATIRLAASGWDNDYFVSGSVSARSDGEGRFRIEGLAPAHYWLHVERDGYLEQMIPAQLVPADEVRVRLAEAKSLRGSVLSHGAREPVAAATVMLVTRDYRSLPGLARTDDLGQFVLDRAPRARPLRLLATDGQGAYVEAEVGREDAEVVLGKTRTLRGRVTAEQDGVAQPVGGCRLLIQEPSTPAVQREVISDERGEFVLRVAEGARVILSAAPHSGWRVVAGSTIEARTSAANPLALRVLPVTTTTVSGRVLLSDGSPAPSAVVTIECNAKTAFGRFEGSSVTTRNGEFVLRGVPLGCQGARVVARLDGRQDAASAPFDIEDPDGHREVVVNLGAGAAIHGRVLDSSGQPIRGARVLAFRNTTSFVAGPDRPLDYVEPAFSDHDGRYRLAGLTPADQTTIGKLFVSVHRSGFKPVTGLAVVPSPGGTELADIVLEPVYALTGRVVDERGRPIAAAYVTGAGGRGTTNGDGWFELSGIVRGMAEIGAYATGYEKPVKVAVRVPATEPLTIALVRGLDITGVVLDASGMAVQGATVFAKRNRNDASGHLSEATDDQGRFRIAGVPKGAWRVEVIHPPVGLRFDVVAEVEAGTSGVLLQARPTASVRGSVVGARGTPLAGVTVHAARWPVSARRWRDVTIARGRTDAEGRFELPGLEGEQCVVWIDDPRWAAEPLTGVGVGGVIEVIAQEGATIEGEVVGATAGLSVTVSRESPPVLCRATITDGEGRFRVQGLPSGPFRIEVLDRTGMRARRTGVEPGTGALRIELGPAPPR